MIGKIGSFDRFRISKLSMRPVGGAVRERDRAPSDGGRGNTVFNGGSVRRLCGITAVRYGLK